MVLLALRIIEERYEATMNRLTFRQRNFLVKVPLFRSIRYFIVDYSEFVSSRKFRVLKQVIERNCIENVVDVGANIGQFGLEMRRMGFQGNLYSYEPVTDSFDLLTKTASSYKRWSCFKFALGNREGQSKIGVSRNFGLSSSILRILSSHTDHSPNSEFIKHEDIQVTTLDREIARLGIPPETTLFKIDVQGFELEVLLGALANVNRMAVLLIEVSLVELYENSPTLNEILSFFEEHSSHQIINIFRSFSKQNGDLLQIDILLELAKDS